MKKIIGFQAALLTTTLLFSFACFSENLKKPLVISNSADVFGIMVNDICRIPKLREGVIKISAQQLLNWCGGDLDYCEITARFYRCDGQLNYGIRFLPNNRAEPIFGHYPSGNIVFRENPDAYYLFFEG